jgi:glucose-fructose oxidoreductase
MIEAARSNDVRLMIAYRLHFEKANLEAVSLAQSGKLGDLRIFQSLFTMQVRDEDNIRLKRATGGGPLYDIGIYCINAARGLFRAEPLEVIARRASNGQKRFREVEEMSSVLMRFPQDRLASFTASFGASDHGAYELVGTKGYLRVDPAYEYADALKHVLTIGETTAPADFSEARPVRTRARLLLRLRARGPRARALGPRRPGRRPGHPRGPEIRQNRPPR